MDNGEREKSRRVEELSDQVRALTERVARLEDQVQRGQPAGEAAGIRHEVREKPGSAEAVSGERKGPLSMGGMTAIFSRIATISLILVVALVLRLLTDNGMVNLKVGSLLGIGYASLLEATGWIMYRKSHPFASIFSVSGALLLFSVVIETQARFGSISSLPAYGVLIVAAGGLAVISQLQKVAIPVCVGTVGLIFAGIPIDFPSPSFVYLAVLLLAANAMAFSASNIPKCWWLRQVAVGSTLLVYLAWAFKLSVALRSGEQVPGHLFLQWFLPFITIMAILYISMSYRRISRNEGVEVGFFDSLLPAIAAIWAYALSFLVFHSASWNLRVLGVGGIIAATGLLGLAFLIVRIREEGSTGANVFAFPAAFLLALSFRDVSGESIIALAILSWAGLNLGFLSRRWKSSGVRVTSYFLQVTVMGASLLLLASSPSGEISAVTIGSCAAVAVIAFTHYRLSRKFGPPTESWYFRRLDTQDRSAASLFLVSLAGSFLMFRALAHVVIAGMLNGSQDAFRSAQSMIINFGAIGLFLVASRQKNVEVKMVAVLVTVIGGFKVFFLDFLGIRGLPLVMSVLSFGLAAALAAVVLSRWQKTSPEQG